MLYMFRTVLVHHQEQLYKLYIAFGICRYHTSGCCVAIREAYEFTSCHRMPCTALWVDDDGDAIFSL